MALQDHRGMGTADAEDLGHGCLLFARSVKVEQPPDRRALTKRLRRAGRRVKRAGPLWLVDETV